MAAGVRRKITLTLMGSAKSTLNYIDIWTGVSTELSSTRAHLLGSKYSTKWSSESDRHNNPRRLDVERSPRKKRNRKHGQCSPRRWGTIVGQEHKKLFSTSRYLLCTFSTRICNGSSSFPQQTLRSSNATELALSRILEESAERTIYSHSKLCTSQQSAWCFITKIIVVGQNTNADISNTLFHYTHATSVLGNHHGRTLIAVVVRNPEWKEKDQMKMKFGTRKCWETEAQSLPIRLSRLKKFVSSCIHVNNDAQCTRDPRLEMIVSRDTSMNPMERSLDEVAKQCPNQHTVMGDSCNNRLKLDRKEYPKTAHQLVDNLSCVWNYEVYCKLSRNSPYIASE